MIILGIIVLNMDKYIAFMNMDIETYKTFAMYGLIQMFLQLLLNLSFYANYIMKMIIKERINIVFALI